jgi:PAS domain S-box-containing protein
MSQGSTLPPGLEDPERQFDCLFRGSPYGAVFLDEMNHILACNEAACRIFGLTEKEIDGMSSFDPTWHAMHEDGSDFLPETFPSVECLRLGVPVRGVMGIWNPLEGRHRWIRIDAVPLFGGLPPEPHNVLVWIDDITNQIVVKAAGKRLRSRFRSLFDNMAEGVALHEMTQGSDGSYVNYRIVDVNARFESQVGIPREKVLGKLGSEAYGVSPAPYLEVYGQVVRSGTSHHFDTYFPPLDRYFTISVAPLGHNGFATISSM